MRCIVPNCFNESCKTTRNIGITFHPFPTDKNTLKAWRKSLCLTSYKLPENNFICSEHFNERDIFITNHGLKKIHHDAVPVNLDPDAPASSKVCRICFVTDDKMRSFKKYHKLFEDVTGIPLDDEDSRLPQRICWECAARLAAAANFRAKALLSDGMLHDLLNRESELKFSHLKPMKRVIREYGFESKLKQVTFDVEHFDMNIRDTYVDTKHVPKLEDNYVDNDLHEIVEENQVNNESELTNNAIHNGSDKIEFTNKEIDHNVETEFTQNHINNGDETEYTNNEYNNAETDYTKNKIDHNDETESIDNGIHDETGFINNNFVVDAAEDTDSTETDIPEVNNDNESTMDYQECENNDSFIEILNEDIVEDEESTEEVTDRIKRRKCLVVNHKNARNILKGIGNESEGYVDPLPIKKGGVIVFNTRSYNKIPEELSPLKPHFTITPLSQEQLIKEVQERKNTAIYLAAPYKCHVCYHAFGDNERFDAHMTRHDTKNGPYQCSICLIFKRRAGNLRTHMKMHSFQFACKRCNWVTRHSQVALGHIKFHEGDTLTCPHCSQTFDRKTTYYNHLRIIHMTDIVCELCGYAFITKIGLKQHKGKTHTHIYKNPPPFEGPHCDKCDVTFLSQEAYDTHLRCSSKHLDGETDPFRIRNERGTRIILPSRSKTTKYAASIKCEQCGEKCDSVRAYKLHFVNYHPGMTPTKRCREPVMCEQCGKIYASRAHLASHQWVHTGKKLNQCHKCDKSYSQKMNLTHHIRIAHTNVAPLYKCDICRTRTFNFPANLVKHVQQCHTNHRPWKCKLCERSFLFPNELRKHVDFVHNKKPYSKRSRIRKKALQSEELD